MLIPLGERPAGGNDQPGIGGRGLQRLALPSIERALHRGSVMSAAEQREQSIAMMRQIGMQPDPTAVAAAIKARDRIMILRRRLAIDVQVALAAKLDRGVAHVDADVLASTRAQPPQLGGGESGGSNGCPRRRTDRE